MSKIDQLINQLCPDGVEYRTLGSLEDAGLITLGRGKVISKQDIQNNPGDYPIYSSSATNNGLLGSYGAYMFDEELITWSIDGGGKFFYRPASRYSVTNVCGWLRVNDDQINAKYLYHTLLNEWHKKVFDYVHKAHPSTIRKEYAIPMPPLEVQNEVVRILDSFTELTTELTAELATRKRQYEYYRDTLLSFDGRDDFEMSTIGSLSNYRRGSFPQPYGNREWYDGDGAMPFVQVADIGDDMLLVPDTKRKISKIAQPKSVFAPAGSIIISLQGSIGRIAITQYDAFIDRTVAIFQDIDKKILPKYFVYQLQRIFAIKEKTARGSTIKTITKEEFTSFPIPIPSIEEQKCVVSILDRFNKLCSDVAEGLPAEIIGRNRQYEYYRDKLLTFKELKAA